jgi:hypothetical protein
MGEVSHFRQAYKWLAVPPMGDHQPDPSTLAGNFSNKDLIGPFMANVNKTRHNRPIFALGESGEKMIRVQSFKESRSFGR